MTEGGAPLALAMLMAGGAGGAALPAPPAGAAPTISAQQLAEYYPALAQRKNVQGDVVLDCVVTAAGGLERCAVAAERPAGYGFGAASMQVAAHLHVGPTLADGSPSAGRSYRLPIRWTTPPAPARNSTPAAPATGAAATGVGSQKVRLSCIRTRAANTVATTSADSVAPKTLYRA